MDTNQNRNQQTNGMVIEKPAHTSMQFSQLMQLFKNELRDIFWAERALTTAIPKMIKNASSLELIVALTTHLEETNQHVERLQEVFAIIDERPFAKKCDAIEDLIEESFEIMESYEKGSMRDAGIILAIQKVEHYEIATYRSLCYFAQILGLNKAVPLLAATLHEEKLADEKLAEVAITAINVDEFQEII
jgi:ferritin-like metal-binding protein YciE